MTYYNKFKDVEVQLPDAHTRMDGEVMFVRFKGVEFPKGSGNVFEFAGTRRSTGWTPNLILNQGLDFYSRDMGGTDTCAGCIVGTSSTAESVLQTGCIAPVAYAGDSYLGYGNVDGNSGAAPWYGWRESKYRYSPNFAGGNVNINEIAITDGTGTGLTERNTMGTARALTRDGNGDPTTISVLDDEYLDVYYRRRQYAGLISAAGVAQYATGTIDVGGVSTDYSMGPYAVGNDAWGANARAWFTLTGYYYGQYDRGRIWSSDAVHGAVTSFPTATEGDHFYYTYPTGYSTYTAGTYTQSAWMTMGLDQGNISGGIGAVGLFSSRGCYAAIVDPVIPKDNTKVFTWWQNWSWDRYTI